MRMLQVGAPYWAAALLNIFFTAATLMFACEAFTRTFDRVSWLAGGGCAILQIADSLLTNARSGESASRVPSGATPLGTLDVAFELHARMPLDLACHPLLVLSLAMCLLTRSQRPAAQLQPFVTLRSSKPLYRLSQ